MLGLLAGMKPADVISSITGGLGGTLGTIAIVIGLGTMLGKMMAESGGAEQIATTLVDRFGVKRVHWAMMIVGFIVGIPVFFEVGVILMIPIIFTVARKTNMSLLPDRNSYFGRSVHCPWIGSATSGTDDCDRGFQRKSR